MVKRIITDRMKTVAIATRRMGHKANSKGVRRDKCQLKRHNCIKLSLQSDSIVVQWRRPLRAVVEHELSRFDRSCPILEYHWSTHQLHLWYPSGDKEWNAQADWILPWTINVSGKIDALATSTAKTLLPLIDTGGWWIFASLPCAVRQSNSFDRDHLRRAVHDVEKESHWYINWEKYCSWYYPRSIAGEGLLRASGLRDMSREIEITL